VEEFLVPETHCFTQASIPTSVLLAIGAGCQVTFHSDQSVPSTLDTVSKVMCLEKVDNSLFAGLDTGFIVVISWKVKILFFSLVDVGLSPIQSSFRHCCYCQFIIIIIIIISSSSSLLSPMTVLTCTRTVGAPSVDVSLAS
jgi:hypothetical protein